MSGATIMLVLNLINLTGPDGQQIEVNPDQVVALRAPRQTELGHFAPGVKCLVYTTDTHYVGVTQTCNEVRARLEMGPVVPIPRERPQNLETGK